MVDTATGTLTEDQSGACVVSSVASVSSYAPDGRLAWTVPTEGPAPQPPVITPDGTHVRIEGGWIVCRHPGTGAPTRRLPAAGGSGLSVAPWGDLLYAQTVPGGVALVHCVTRSGRHRWSTPLDRASVPVGQPFALGDVVVVECHGRLRSLDRDGRIAWVAELGEDGRTGMGEDRGVRVYAGPVRVAADRVVLELVRSGTSGLYLLDGHGARLTPVAVPSPAHPPYAVLGGSGVDYRLAGLASLVRVAEMRWECPVTAVAPGGARVWERRLAARADVLVPGPAGTLIVGASPSVRRWDDYRQWYDLSAETFVCCLGPEGAPRWTWPAPGPITHFPVVTAGGTVYVGSAEQLWALAC